MGDGGVVGVGGRLTTPGAGTSSLPYQKQVEEHAPKPVVDDVFPPDNLNSGTYISYYGYMLKMRSF